MQPTSEQLQEKSEHELLMIIGQELKGHRAGAMPRTPEETINVASAWTQALLHEIRPQLCRNPAIMAVRDNSDQAALISAVAGFLATMSGIVSPAPVATLLVRLGLKTICRS